MKVKFKKLHERAVIPTKAHPTDAGFDLVAVSIKTTEDYLELDTGIAIELPPNHVALGFPRSSITNTDLMLKNSVMVVDSGYRGSIKFRFTIKSDKWHDFKLYVPGDKIGQLLILPYPTIEFVEVDELGDSDRGENGFGSSGN